MGVKPENCQVLAGFGLSYECLPPVVPVVSCAPAENETAVDGWPVALGDPPSALKTLARATNALSPLYHSWFDCECGL